jgi:hypothetical protein
VALQTGIAGVHLVTNHFVFNSACLKKCGDYTVVLLLNKAKVDELSPQFFKGF